MTPLNTKDFGLFEHKVQYFNAIVPGTFEKKDLENPAFWVHVAPKIREIGAEIRCIADDMSFVAYLIVTFVQGSVVRVKLTHACELEKVDYEALTGHTSEYGIKLKGPRRWCIVKLATDEIIKENIATQTLALRELEQFQKANAA